MKNYSKPELKPISNSPVVLSKKFKLNINKRIWNQIAFLCKQVSKIEWSGIVFYSEQGKLEDLDTFEITVEDIFLKSIDTAGATSYEPDSSDRLFMRDHPQHMRNFEGNIHSHHTMTTFFSDTDVTDLEDQGERTNYFLSIIVNNAGDIIARIAWMTEVTITNHIQAVLYSNNEEEYKLDSPNSNTDYRLVYANADINVERDDEVEDWFVERYNSTVQEMKEREVQKNLAKQTQTTVYRGGQGNTLQGSNWNPTFTAGDVNNFLSYFLDPDDKTYFLSKLSEMEKADDWKAKVWITKTFASNKLNNVFRLHFPKAFIGEEFELYEDCISHLEIQQRRYPKICTKLINAFKEHIYNDIPV